MRTSVSPWPADCAVVGQVGHPWLAAVMSANLPRAGKGGAVPLLLSEFVGSVARLAWAKANGCPWGVETCGCIAWGGRPEVLQWAREHGCEWNWMTCESAAAGGHLSVLQWAREHDFPWSEITGANPLGVHFGGINICTRAAEGGHLDVLKFARDNGCEWDYETCSGAAEGGHLAVLQWAWEQGYPW